MDLRHTFTVPAAIDRAWEMFNDLQEIAGCFPGATLGRVDEDSFDGSVKVRLGPISLVYTGSGTFVERDHDAHRAVIEAKGKDKRGNGTASATVTASMTGTADSTDVEVITDLQVTGKPAQLGRGMIQDVSDKLLGQFVDCVTGKLTPPAEPDASTEALPSEAPEPPAPDPEPVDESGAGAGLAGPGPEPEQPPQPPAPPAPPPAEPGPPPRPPAQDEPAQLDMLGTVGPVLAKRYGVPAAVGLAMLVIGILIGRRRAQSHRR